MKIDLYRGPGGWDQGARMLGITDIDGIDNDPVAHRIARPRRTARQRSTHQRRLKEGRPMTRNTMNPTHWTAFLRVLDTVPAGNHASSNILRDLLAAADIPVKSRGGLFSQAVNQGYLRPVGNRYEPSEGETAHRSVVRIYRRTRKQQEAVAA